MKSALKLHSYAHESSTESDGQKPNYHRLTQGIIIYHVITHLFREWAPKYKRSTMLCPQWRQFHCWCTPILLELQQRREFCHTNSIHQVNFNAFGTALSYFSEMWLTMMSYSVILWNHFVLLNYSSISFFSGWHEQHSTVIYRPDDNGPCTIICHRSQRSQTWLTLV